MRCLLFWPLAAMVAVASAQSVPPLVNYQGRLASPDGTPLPTADYALTVRLYDSPSEGRLIWGPQHFDGATGPGHGPRIPVIQGYFNLMLGPADTNGVGLSVAFTNTPCFVEVAVSNRAPVLPRQQILSTPFAFQAGNAAKLAGYDWSLLFGASPPGVRQVGPDVDAGGVAVSPPVLEQRLTTAGFVDVQNLQVRIRSSGRPILAFVVPSLDSFQASTPDLTKPSLLHFVPDAGNNHVVLRLVRDGGAHMVATQFGTGAGGASAVGYPSTIGPFMDLPPPGIHTYRMQWGFVSNQGQAYAKIHNAILLVYEL